MTEDDQRWLRRCGYSVAPDSLDEFPKMFADTRDVLDMGAVGRIPVPSGMPAQHLIAVGQAYLWGVTAGVAEGKRQALAEVRRTLGITDQT